MAKKSYYFLSLLLLIISVTSCSQSSSNNPKQLTLGLLPTADALPFHVAQNLGFFEDEGIQVDLQVFQSCMERDSAIQSKGVDAIAADLVGATLLKSKGIDVQIGLLTIGHEPGTGRLAILSSPQSSIKSPRDIEKLQLGLSRHGAVEFVADSLIEHEGIQLANVEKVAVPKMSIRLNMLLESQVEAAIFPDPMAKFAETQGCTLLMDDTELNLSQGALVFRCDSLQNKSTAAKALVRAYNRAVDTIALAPSQYESLLAKVTNTPESWSITYPVKSYPYNQVPSHLQIERVAEWLIKRDSIKEAIPYEKLVTVELVSHHATQS